ncbi:MAG: DUF2442 domain-containing protein [Chloroflexi bacterium]|nr:DUF2442 domain-containing protein [Chloroflexota bacterium]
MITFDDKLQQQVVATNVRFENNNLVIILSDGRELVVPLGKYDWLQWLAHATPEQRAHWSLEPNGFAIYWDELDDGIEIEHVLSLYALS